MNHKKILPLFFLFSIAGSFLFVSIGHANAATYYVKNGGNDSAAGTSDATAWASIAKVEATVKSGDTVYFRSQDTWTSTSAAVLIATAGVTYDGATYGSGTRAKFFAGADEVYNHPAIVEIGVGNVTFRGFEVDGTGHFNGGIYVGTTAANDMSNVTVDNCVVHDIGNRNDWIYGIDLGPTNQSKNILVSNVTVTNTVVYNTAHEGIAIYPTWQGNYKNTIDTVLLKNNNIYNAGVYGGGPGVSVVNAANNVTIEHNNIYNNNGDGVWVRVSPDNSHAPTGAPNNLVVRYNNIYNNKNGLVITDCWGLTMTGSFYSNLIYNNIPGDGYSNVAISPSTYENRVDCKDFGSSVINIFNNTIYSVAGSGQFTSGVSVAEYSDQIEGTPTFNLKNNIIYAGNYAPVYDHFGWLTHSNNLIYRSSGASDSAVSYIRFSSAAPSATVTVSNDSNYTYFTKNDAT